MGGKKIKYYTRTRFDGGHDRYPDTTDGDGGVKIKIIITTNNGAAVGAGNYY